MKMPRLACLPSITVAAGILLSLASASVLAQGTDEERRACTPDVMRLCREFIPSVSAITQCLVDKRAELNPDCRLVMTPKPQPVQQAAAKRRAAEKRPPAAAKRAAAEPAPVVRSVSTEPGEVIRLRPPVDVPPPPATPKPASKTANPYTEAAPSAAVAPAKPRKKTAAKPAPEPKPQ
jgi:hypothetical protein